MRVVAVKTDKITKQDSNLLAVLDKYILDLPERSVLAITSKIVAICEGRVVPKDSVTKAQLVRQEAELLIPPEVSKYNITLTVTRGLLVPTAGIDESNTIDGYVLWPADPQNTANKVRKHFMQKFGRKELGVVITDSKTSPLRWGVTGAALAYSGFVPLRDLIGTPDIFGHLLKVTKVNVYDSLAGAAVFVMGEGDEQTPLAIITELDSVEFVSDDPEFAELESLKISLEDDLYSPLLINAPWEKRG